MNRPAWPHESIVSFRLVHAKTRTILYQCSKCHYKIDNNHQHFLNHIDHQHGELLEVRPHSLPCIDLRTPHSRISYELLSDRVQPVFVATCQGLSLRTNRIPYVSLQISHSCTMSPFARVFVSVCLSRKTCMNISVSFLRRRRRLICSVALLYSISSVVVCFGFVFSCF